MSESGTSPRWRVLLSLALVVGLVAGAAGVGAAGHAQQQPAEPTFAAALHEDGSARVTLTVTFDLATDSERRAFRELQENGTALAETGATFADRLSQIADRTTERTGREMAVSDPAVSLREADGTGYVDLSVTWSGLARVEGDRLTVVAPFDDGFQPSRAFVVSAPEGYELATAEPTPDTTGEATARWAAGTTTEEFRLVATPADSSADATDGAVPGSDSPGFGVATVALVVTLLAAALRRR